MLHPRASLSVVSQATDIVAVLTVHEWKWGALALGETRTEARPPTLHNSMPPYLIRFPLPQGFVGVYAFCAMILLSSCPSPPLINTQLLLCVATFPVSPSVKR